MDLVDAEVRADVAAPADLVVQVEVIPVPMIKEIILAELRALQDGMAAAVLMEARVPQVGTAAMDQAGDQALRALTWFLHRVRKISKDLLN